MIEDMDPFWIKPLKNWEMFHILEENLRKGNVSVDGLGLHAKTHLVASLMYTLEKSCLYIADNELSARSIADELDSYFPEKVRYFPPRELVFYQTEAQSNEITQKRLKVLVDLTQNKKMIVVSSIESLMSLQSDLDSFKEGIFTIKVGMELPLQEISEKLIDLSYERVDLVEGAGQFSIRGGIVDFFSPVYEKPYRIEMFDDIVDLIREFDPITQRSSEKYTEAYVVPAHELILTSDTRKRALNSLNQDFEDTIANLNAPNQKSLKKKITSKFGLLYENLQEKSNITNIESLIYYFYPNKTSLVDYFSNDTLLILDEPIKVEQAANTVFDEFKEQFKDLLELGEVLPLQANSIFETDEISAKLRNFRRLSLRDLTLNTDYTEPSQTIAARSSPAWNGNLQMMIEDLGHFKSKGYSVIVSLNSEKQVQGFISLLANAELDAVSINPTMGDIHSGQIYATVGNITKGFEYPDAKFMILTEKDVYGTLKKASRSRRGNKKPSVLSDFKVGDYVVHENHGIGKYIGINTLLIEGRKRDYLEIQYFGAAKVYVPTEALDLIQPYTVADSMEPKLSKLGGADWQKAKTKVTESVKKLAIDLVQLYAERQTTKGYSFSEDTDWQNQLEAQFPYEETPDQLLATEDIKRDMESKLVMDRLLCGDVGYGKTEVAMRAAFKACMDSKQVAVLAPTTILAQQHYNSFIKRFSEFPFKIEVLSRFKTKLEQKSIIKALKEGEIDVVIGTHRLLGKDIRFKDLGLLIIDEEQRFGVSHKETIKDIKKDVDVLTLTATPIPRTLHMSLAGIRDISVIESPPEGRFPVQTYVTESDDNLLRNCIFKEIARGGQVYFVYNKVKNMDTMAEKLRTLVPGIKISIAHGQMNENMLEEVMIDFYENKSHLLLCSTIIENGVDIPNVNTLIVYDCDHFGLSQLYQLRGRVGRSNRKAYAYFVYRKDKILSEQASKRLRTIKEFTEFGAGFKIAMRDMEIRGAGNIMGAEQHGHMVSVGYDMYYRLLKNAVDELKGLTKEKVETVIDIKTDAHISEEYIPEQGQRIGIYKKIAAIECEEDKFNVEEELEDRYGDPPQAVRNLVDIAYIRALGMKLGILDISHFEKTIKLKFSSKEVDKRKIMTLINENRNSLDYLSSNPVVLSLRLKDSKPDIALVKAKELIVKMNNLFSA